MLEISTGGKDAQGIKRDASHLPRAMFIFSQYVEESRDIGIICFAEKFAIIGSTGYNLL